MIQSQVKSRRFARSPSAAHRAAMGGRYLSDWAIRSATHRALTGRPIPMPPMELDWRQRSEARSRAGRRAGGLPQ